MMARIIDKNTRLIDIDFGPLTVNTSRQAGEFAADVVTVGRNGQSQLLNLVPPGPGTPAVRDNLGSFLQYERLDLSFMTNNNEIMLPTEVSVQRTSPVPLGFNINGNNYEQIEEYIFIFSRPLNNTNLAEQTTTGFYDLMRDMGLDGSSASAIGGSNVSGDAGWPDQAQTIYAEKRMYSYSTNLMATIANGE